MRPLSFNKCFIFAALILNRVQTKKMEYKFAEIEPKWQKYWEENKTFKTEDDFSKPK